MKGVRVIAWGNPPECIDVPDLPPPSPTQLRLKVLAAGVTRAVQGRAARLHPSAFDQPLPYDPSIDGVGRHEETGDLYFIHSPASSVFDEYANVERSQLFRLARDADPVSVAALAPAAMRSWLALTRRTTGDCCRGRTVAILGATSSSGRCAARVARLLGAARVVGVSRDPATLAGVAGLDVRVVRGDPLRLPDGLGPVHVVLDFVGGATAAQLLQAVEVDPAAGGLQYIRTGGLAGCEFLHILAPLAKIKPIRVTASGMGSLSREDLAREMPAFVNALGQIKTPPFDVLAAPMSDVQSVWNSEEVKTKRLVLVP